MAQVITHVTSKITSSLLICSLLNLCD